MFKRLHSRFWQFAIVIGIMLSLFLASCAQTLVDPIQLSTTNQTLSLTNPNAHETKIQLLNPTKEEYFRYEWTQLDTYASNKGGVIEVKNENFVYERIIGFTQDALNGNLQWQKFTINFFCKLIYLRTNKAVQAASVKITIDASLDVPFTIDISNYVLDYGNQLDESLISIFLFQSRRADFDYTINFSDDSYSNLVVFSVNNAESNSDGDFNDETSLINYKLYFNEESSYFRNSKWNQFNISLSFFDKTQIDLAQNFVINVFAYDLATMNNFFLEPLNSNSTIDHHTLNDSVQINVKNAENFDISFDALPSDPQMLTNILSLTTYSSEKYAIIALKSSAPYHWDGCVFNVHCNIKKNGVLIQKLSMQINLVSYGEIIEGLVDEKVYFSSSKSNILNDVNDESQVFLNFNDLLDDPLASVPTILVTQDSNYATYTYDTTSLCVNVKYNSLVPTTYQNEYYPVKIMFITVGFTYNYYFFYLRRSRPPRVEVFATKNIVSLDESTIVTANCKYAASSTWSYESSINDYASYVNISRNNDVATIKYNDAYHINFFLKVKVACGNVNSSIIINFLTKPTLSIDSNKNVLSSVNDVATITVDNESDTEVLWSISPNNLIQHVEFSFSENTATLKYISEFSNNNQVFSVVVNCGGELSIYNILATTKKNTKIDLKASRVATFLYSKTDYANYDKVTLTATVSNKVGNLVWSFVGESHNNYLSLSPNYANNTCIIEYINIPPITTYYDISCSNNGTTAKFRIYTIAKKRPTITFTSTGNTLEYGITNQISYSVKLSSDFSIDNWRWSGIRFDDKVVEGGTSIDYVNNSSTFTIKFKSSLPEFGWSSSNYSIDGKIENTNFIKYANFLLKERIESDDKYYNYIFDRTFSILQIVYPGSILGTMWLYKRIPKNKANYVYYAFTNWHVMNDMIKIKDDGYFFQPTEAAYTQSGNINDNDNLGFTGWPVATDYKPFISSYNWLWSAGVGTAAAKNSRVCDIAMVEVNFGVPTNHKGIKDRLDRLNNQFAINEPMVKFSKNPIVDKPKYTSTYHYLAGYPFIYNGNEVDYSGGSSTLFTKTKSSIINLVAGGVSHMGADSSVAPKQYRYNNGILGHGASGSMVIDRLGEIVGIYWGSNPREKYGYSHILNYPGVYNVLAQCPFL